MINNIIHLTMDLHITLDFLRTVSMDLDSLVLDLLLITLAANTHHMALLHMVLLPIGMVPARPLVKTAPAKQPASPTTLRRRIRSATRRRKLLQMTSLHPISSRSLASSSRTHHLSPKCVTRMASGTKRPLPRRWKLGASTSARR